jgi:hypothetical protein
VFPDYAWELRHVVERTPWLAVHLHDTGTRHQYFLGAPATCPRSRPTSSPSVGSPTGVSPNSGAQRTTLAFAYKVETRSDWASGRSANAPAAFHRPFPIPPCRAFSSAPCVPRGATTRFA